MKNELKEQKPDIIEETDKAIMKKVGQKIRALRDSKTLSAETLASNIGLSRSSLTQIELGKNNINAVILWKLACRLECNINDFFPKVLKGFGLTKVDLTNIAKEDEDALKWGENLFGVKKDKDE